MATQTKQAQTREPLKARPLPEADVKAITADITERFSKSLEYLGR